MKIEILENGNILVEKNNINYLIEKFRIRGTFIDNYSITEEETEYYVGEYATLEDALLYIYKECN